MERKIIFIRQYIKEVHVAFSNNCLLLGNPHRREVALVGWTTPEQG